MPELPEVETTRRGISPYIQKKKVRDVIVRQSKLRWPVPKDLQQQLVQKQLQSVERRGKYLILRFAHGCVLIHLGMSGSLRLSASDDPPGKHDHVDIAFGKQHLRFHDPRRFGFILWTTAPLGEHPRLKNLGPEPLSEDFCAEYLFKKSRQRKQAVKPWIMNSPVVVGVGNIYANESLFAARINPQQSAKDLSLAQCRRWVSHIKAILQKAIDQGGTTLRDFVGGDGKPGYFAQQLQVYGRGAQACHKCQDTLIEIRQGNRSTVYCPSCQPIGGLT